MCSMAPCPKTILAPFKPAPHTSRTDRRLWIKYQTLLGSCCIKYCIRDHKFRDQLFYITTWGGIRYHAKHYSFFHILYVPEVVFLLLLRQNKVKTVILCTQALKFDKKTKVNKINNSFQYQACCWVDRGVVRVRQYKQRWLKLGLYGYENYWEVTGNELLQ